MVQALVALLMALPQAPPSAVVRGTVVSDGDERPLRLANVVLIGTVTGTLRVTSTDDDGRFSFAGLPADRYTVGASKPPYLGAVAGARRPARPGTPVVVGDGETVADVIVRLPRGASISGVITDERGQPATSVRVDLQQWRTENGERVLVPGGGSGYTDDRGRYRVHSLVPGEYIVAATRLGVAAPPRVLRAAEVDEALKTGRAATVDDPSVRYAQVFYPGTARAGDAQPVRVASGEERPGVDFRLELVRTVRVQGTVTTSDGQPPARATVRLVTYWIDRQPISSRAFGAMTLDGRFEFGGVAPGTYTLIATGSGPQAIQFATEIVEVAGADRTGLQLTLRPALSLAARLVFDGASAAPPLPGHRVPLRSLTGPASGIAAPAVAPTDDSGAFAISRVTPGRYVLGGPMFFGATAASVTWSLTSVTVDGRDVTDLPFDVSADAPPREIVVTYGDRWQEISGRLLQSSGAPAPGYVVVAFPADQAYWIGESRRILTAPSDAAGRFTLGGPGPLTLPAGEYLLAVVPDLERDEQFDRAFLASLVSSAVRVGLRPGEQKVQDLAIR
jgi:hypothetical protein